MKSAGSKLTRAKLTFERLIDAVRDVHEQLRAQAGRAINISLTLRNWLIGAYIAEYELRGTDRASYGENLLNELANRLAALKVSNCNRRELYRYLRFYRLYPAIVGTLSPQLTKLLPAARRAVRKVGTASPQLRVSPQNLLQNLSYSHLEQLVDLDDDLKRAFYEIECLRGTGRFASSSGKSLVSISSDPASRVTSENSRAWFGPAQSKPNQSWPFATRTSSSSSVCDLGKR